MDLGLQGKVAVVTGGSDGIGKAAATALAAEGAQTRNHRTGIHCMGIELGIAETARVVDFEHPERARRTAVRHGVDEHESVPAVEQFV